MDWYQVITIIGVLGGFMFYMLQRIENDIHRIENRMDKTDSRLDGHAQRIDQMYTIILQMLKERK
ncbi:MAG: hypothetical protein AABY22_14510 [Nanoarchaeota archaeon]